MQDPLLRTPHRGGLAAGECASDRSRTRLGLRVLLKPLAARIEAMLVHTHGQPRRVRGPYRARHHRWFRFLSLRLASNEIGEDQGHWLESVS
jgi:hypothetical protein